MSDEKLAVKPKRFKLRKSSREEWLRKLPLNRLIIITEKKKEEKKE